jgi:signal transduction histidine kinase/ligand-binding sensor domain-containing protein
MPNDLAPAVTITMKKILAVVVTAWLAFSGSRAAVAGPAKNHVAPIELQHTAWTARDGAPPNIRNIEQTADGWLWLGGDDGLYRFDGAKFELYQPLSGSLFSGGVLAMGRLADGRLWLSSGGSGLALLRDGVPTTYGHADGLPIASFYKVVQEANGRLWVASSAGIYQLEPGARRWHEANAAMGLSSKFLALDLLQDRRGAFWLLSTAGLFSRPPGATVFTKVAERHTAGKMVETPDGRVWASVNEGHGLQLLYAPPGTRAAPPDTSMVSAIKFMFDNAGNLWFPGETGVEQLLFDGGKTTVREFTVQHGLTAAEVLALHQDREGNIWIATPEGLDQFRPRRVQELRLAPMLTFGAPLLAGGDGDVWIDQYHYRALDAAPVRYGPGAGDATLVTALYRDPRGQVWSAARDGLWRVNGGRRVPVAPPADLGKHRFIVILGMVMDTDGGLWVSFAGSGVFRLKDGAWSAFGGVPELEKAVVVSMTADTAGRLWFGTFDNAVFKLEAGKAVKLGAREGLALGVIEAITPYRNGVLVGGQPGLMWFDGKVFRSLRGAGEARFSGVKGVLVAPDGRVWINSSRGLQGIDAGDIAHATQQPDYPMRVLQFNFDDGVRGVAANESSTPRLTRLSSGELLFSTTSGVYRLDPEHYPTNRSPPPVYVTGVWSDNAAQPSRPTVQLPASPQSVRVDYTALSLTLPRRVRFRYMLDGVDTQWQEAGNRRSAYYTTLAPGSYRFRVMAANEDGVWNNNGASVTLVVPPTLMQTVWFKLLCVALAALLVWGVHRLRLRVALRRMQRSFDVRTAERERIARTLHDTYLQSVHSLILRFHSIKAALPKNDAVQQHIDAALDAADAVAEEGRDQLMDLRVNDVCQGDLAPALETAGGAACAQQGVAFAVVEQGLRRALKNEVKDELFAIAREAVANALRHSGSAKVWVQLVYDSAGMTLAVRDQGKGFDSQVLQPGTPERHWGLTGMRERAARIGAVLAIHSKTDNGTSVEVTLRARSAYL